MGGHISRLTPAEKLLRRGKKLWKLGRWHRAVKNFRDAAEQYLVDGNLIQAGFAYTQLAECCRILKQWTDAKIAYGAAWTYCPSNLDLVRNYIQCLIEIDQTAAADDLIKILAAQSTGTTMLTALKSLSIRATYKVWMYLAEQYIRIGQEDYAISIYEQWARKFQPAYHLLLAGLCLLIRYSADVVKPYLERYRHIAPGFANSSEYSYLLSVCASLEQANESNFQTLTTNYLDDSEYLNLSIIVLITRLQRRFSQSS